MKVEMCLFIWTIVRNQNQRSHLYARCSISVDSQCLDQWRFGYAYSTYSVCLQILKCRRQCLLCFMLRINLLYLDWFQMMTAVIFKKILLGLVYQNTVRYQSETEKWREKIYIYIAPNNDYLITLLSFPDYLESFRPPKHRP